MLADDQFVGFTQTWTTDAAGHKSYTDHYAHTSNPDYIKNGKPERSEPGKRSLHDPPDAFGYPVRYLMPAEVDFEGLEQLRKAA